MLKDMCNINEYAYYCHNHFKQNVTITKPKRSLKAKLHPLAAT